MKTLDQILENTHSFYCRRIYKTLWGRFINIFKKEDEDYFPYDWKIEFKDGTNASFVSKNIGGYEFMMTIRNKIIQIRTDKKRETNIK